MEVEAFNILMPLFIILMFNFFIATLWFSRVSVKYIDVELERMGVGKPQWDGLGIRISVYALAILSKWFAKTPIIAGSEVRLIARRKDYYLAYWYNWSFLLLAISGFLLYPFLPG